MSSHSSIKDGLEDLVYSTDNLNLHDGSTDDLQSSTILGDDFLRTWSADNLTLLKCNPCTITSRPIEFSHKFEIESREKLYSTAPLSIGSSITCYIHSMSRLTTKNSKVVYLMKLQSQLDSVKHYNPGDCIGIFCQNSTDDVNWLLERVDLTGVAQSSDSLFVLEPQIGNTRLLSAWLLPGCAVSARFLLTNCCELYVPVTRKVLRLLADHCIDQSVDPAVAQRQRIWLLELSSREGQDIFDSICRKNNVNLMDILYTFSSCRIPLLRLLEMLPRLQPRPYTLINLDDDYCELTKIQTFEFIFTRVDFPEIPKLNELMGLRRYPQHHRGVCTGWLELLGNQLSNQNRETPFPKVQIYLRKCMKQFTLPENSNDPLIMIGAGTGIAPFISFMRKRQKQKLQNPDQHFGPMWLIFGCRSFHSSFLFKDELLIYLNSNLLSHLCLCFSREHPPSGTDEQADLSIDDAILISQACILKDAKYVQDCIWSTNSELTDHMNQIVDLIYTSKAKIMICGEARNMGPSVQEAWIKAISTYLMKVNQTDNDNIDLNLGQEFVTNLKRLNLYQEDIWT